MQQDASTNAIGKLILDAKRFGDPDCGAKQSLESPTVFQRIARADKTAVFDCIDVHGNLIWALAKRITDSQEAAEAATLEIFRAVWKYADRFDPNEMDETDFIVLLARRQLIINSGRQSYKNA